MNEININHHIVVIVLLGVFYNTLLALINAHLFAVNMAISAASEILILSYALVVVLRSQLAATDLKEIILIFAIVILSILISIFNQHLFVDSIRNILIISVFVLLGRRATSETIHSVFFIASFIVAAFLLLEMFYIEGYAELLQPANYYANTRGMEVREYNDTGLFNAALSFEGRFGYGIFDGPRTASTFLEQVSLSNFAIVLSIYLASLWQEITTKNKLFYIGLVLVILITSRSRSALGIILIALLGYQLFPLIPKRLVFLIFPSITLITILVYISFPTNGFEDTLQGRLSHTGHLLYDSNLINLFALDLQNIKSYGDSGIGYILNAFSFFGVLLLWLFIGTITQAQNNFQLRALFLINIYFFATLAISGTSAFSMKTAALLWLLAGFASTLAQEPTENYSPGKPL